MPWPPPRAAAWTALALFLFSFGLHLVAVVGGTLFGLDFKTLIIVDELAAILLAPVIFAVALRLTPRDAFGLDAASWLHYVVAVVAALPLQIFGGALQEIFIEAMPNSEAWREFLDQALQPLLSTEGFAEMLALITGAVVLAAVCEELLFRGLLLRLLVRGGHWQSAIVVTSLLFAAFHLDLIGFLPRTLMGAYFGLLVWRSGSLWPAIVAHGANNLTALIAVPAGEAPETAAGPAPAVLALISGAIFLVLVAWYVRMTRASEDDPAADDQRNRRAQGHADSPGQ